MRSLAHVAGLMLGWSVVAGAQGAPQPPSTPPSPPTVTPAAPAAATAPNAPVPPTPRAGITAAEVDRYAVMRIGRSVAEWANSNKVDSLVATADPAVGSPETVREKLTSGLAQFASELGAETKVSEEKVMIVNGGVQYWRVAEFAAVPVPLVFRVIMGPSGKWRGFTVTPADQVPSGEEVKP